MYPKLTISKQYPSANGIFLEMPGMPTALQKPDMGLWYRNHMVQNTIYEKIGGNM